GREESVINKNEKTPAGTVRRQRPREHSKDGVRHCGHYRSAFVPLTMNAWLIRRPNSDTTRVIARTAAVSTTRWSQGRRGGAIGIQKIATSRNPIPYGLRIRACRGAGKE